MVFGVAGAMIGSAVIGGVMANKAAGKQASAAGQAAATSAAAADRATELQKQMYDQTRADQTPWRNTGANALAQLSYGMGLGDNRQGYGVSNASALDTPGLNVAKTAADYRNELLPQFSTAGPDVWMTRGGIDGVENYMAPGTATINEAGLQAAINGRLAAQNTAEGSPGALGTQGAAFAGQGDSGDLMRSFGMRDYQADPGYAFRLQEGLKALDRRAAARGGLLSGNALKGITRYGQDMASQEYQGAYNRFTNNQSNQYNRLANVAGLGQTANNALQGAGQNYANQAGNYGVTAGANMGNAQIIGGQARASSYTGIGDALKGVDWGKLGGGGNSTLYSPYSLNSFYGGTGTSGD